VMIVELATEHYNLVALAVVRHPFRCVVVCKCGRRDEPHAGLVVLCGPSAP